MSSNPQMYNEQLKKFYGSFPGFSPGFGFPGSKPCLKDNCSSDSDKKPCKKKCCKKKCTKRVKIVANPCPPPCPPPCDPLPCPFPCPPPCPIQCDPCTIIDPFTGPKRAVTTWKINFLVSNLPNRGAHTDIALIDPWGIVVYNAQLWVVANGNDSIMNYDLFGNKLLGTIRIRDARHNSSYPTGLAVNCGGGFPVSATHMSTASFLITASEHGTVHGFGPTIDPQNAYVVLNTQITGQIHVYKGLAIAYDRLYLADFFRRQVEVYDSNFVRLFNFPFVDGDMTDPIPLDFSPNNIVFIGCYLYVIWARKDPHITVHDLDGPGNGYISVFNPDGSFVCRFTSRGVLNSPWAMIPAPMECGFPPGSFLVGNQGDGRINAFDCNGRYIGPLLGQNGLPIVIDGVWGLAPYYTEFSEIFFAASTNENIEGLVGSLVKDSMIYM